MVAAQLQQDWPCSLAACYLVKGRPTARCLHPDETRGSLCPQKLLKELADFLIFSHFVGYRKPDREIWELALHLAQAEPAESIYVDDRELFVEIARQMGFTAVHHVSLEETGERLRQIGLQV